MRSVSICTGSDLLILVAVKLRVDLVSELEKMVDMFCAESAVQKT